VIFVNTPFPECIAYGAQSDPMWSTAVAATVGGSEYTNQNWQHMRHVYDVSFAVRTASDYALIKVHHAMMRGRAKSFPFKDFLDFEVASTEGVTEASGGGYQLFKRYGLGSDAYDRKITRPKTGTLTIYRTRTAVTTDVTGSATISYTTGTFTISGHMSGDVYTWEGEFDVPCRYDTDRLPSVVVTRQGAGELLVQCPSINLLEVKE
jgi:uncharacterized protein (TIGR02217 family)